jgi:hypothetical protein
MFRTGLAALALSAALGGAALAQEVVGGYTAYIGEDDLYNSKGERLTEPWQVLRQDRANFYKFGIRQAGDEADPFFADVNNRAAMEQMVMHGSIDPRAARNLLKGGATVYVTIYGSGGRGDYVQVTVAR